MTIFHDLGTREKKFDFHASLGNYTFFHICIQRMILIVHYIGYIFSSNNTVPKSSCGVALIDFTKSID